jgi:hypothetical protein
MGNYSASGTLHVGAGTCQRRSAKLAQLAVTSAA